MATYTKCGFLTIIPSADLTSLTSDANTVSDARVGSDGIGKSAGMLAIRATDVNDPATYSMVFATGDAAADIWRVVDGSASYTPV